MADQHKNDDEQSVNDCVLVGPTIPEPKALTNIYYDCLERIFDFLDLESLLHVAGTCKRLQIAAAAKFGDEYGCSHKVWLQPWIKWQRIFVYGKGHIMVYGLEFCLKFLRCFGAKTMNLCMNYGVSMSDAQNYCLDRYVSQYCADTLASIQFWNDRSFSSAFSGKPFKNTKRLRTNSCVDLGNQLSKFVNLFPNLHQLELQGYDEKPIDENAAAVSFPQLTDLTVHSYDESDHITKENIQFFLHANRQLQHLEIQVDHNHMELEKLLDLINKNEHILKLKLSGLYELSDVNAVQLNRFAIEHSSLEELILRVADFKVDDAITLISQLNSLKRFEFFVNDQAERDRFLNQLDSKWKPKISPRRSRIIEIIRSNELFVLPKGISYSVQSHRSKFSNFTEHQFNLSKNSQ